MSETMSLSSLLHRGINNTVPDSILMQCAESERVLVENILMVAQAEIQTLNLAGTIITAKDTAVTLQCVVTGQNPSISLKQMRDIQAYSPARVTDVRVAGSDTNIVLIIVLNDSTKRVTVEDTEIIRVVRKRRLW